METMMGITIFSLLYLAGVTVEAQVQVVPEGIESVNGSAVDMGCTSPLIDSGGVMVCGGCSYLTDGVSPDIDTSTSDWASQLVTVRRNEGNLIVLTLAFNANVSLTGIEMDLFLCPDWNIGAPLIYVYLDPDYNLVYQSGLQFVHPDNSPQLSCDSLSTVTITGGSFRTGPYHTFHILVDLTQHDSIEWVQVGEVRFIGIDNSTCLQPPFSSSPIMTPTPNPLSSLSLLHTTQEHIATSLFYPTLSSLSSVDILTSLPPQYSTTSSQYLTTSTQYSTTNMLLSSTQTIPSTPSPEKSDTDNTIMFILVAIIVGLFIMTFILTSLIIFFVKKHSHCTQTNKYTIKTVPYELEKPPTLRSSINTHVEATNPILTSSTDDPRYVSPDSSLETNSADEHYDVIKKEFIYPISEAYYDVVARDEPPQAIELTQTEFPIDIIDGGHYELIPLPVETAFPVKKDPHPPPAQEESTDIPPNSPGDGQSDDEASRLYSIIKRKRAPKVPEKSTDLKDYLAVRIPFNDNIYSESINPSDFISQQPGPEEETLNDPIIYAPIYPPFTVLPESFELPAEVDSNNIEEKSSLRTGHYGEVVLADTVGLSLKDMHLSKTETNKNVSITVAVKKLKLDATPPQRRAFETEAKFLSRLRHPNVVRLLGACYEDPAFIMMEYMIDGDLSQFLQKYSEVVSMAKPSTTQITQSTLVYMASQIASGMKQLAALNFIHRDLATRNCLVGKNFSVKVASLGVDKNIYQSHYFRVQGKTLLPIRWMATECFDGKFSEKSDVWAFGVTMWELFTLAKQLPYRHLTDEEVIHNALKRENRLFPTQSPSCPQSVYEIMEQCWVMDLNERITFAELHSLLNTAL